MAFGRWLIGGLIGGLIGLVAWVAIGYFAQAEVGMVAWGIGFLVGGGVRLGAATDDQDPSIGQGVLAAVLALVTILGAKYMVVEMLVNDAFGDTAALQVDTDISEQDMVMGNVYEILEQKEESGQRINWPAGKSYETAEVKADFPSDVWKAAEAKWSGLSEQEKQGAIAERTTQMQEVAEILNGGLADNVKKEAFLASFGLFDLLWFGLALYTAFNMGFGAEDD